jgi:hypothetical protein
MAIEEEMVTILAGLAQGKRFWGRAPQGALPPYIVMNKVDGLRNYSYTGPTGYLSNRVQIDVYTTSFTATRDLGRQVISALSGHAGGDIQGIFVESERDLPAADAGVVTNLFRTSIDIVVHHGE